MIEIIEKTNRQLGRIAAYCAVVMMLAQVFSVVARYVFSYGIIAVQETVVYGHALMFLLGAAVVLQTNEHVRVDVFYGSVKPRTRYLIDLIGLIGFVLPVALLIGYYSWPYVARAWSTYEGSRQSGGLPAVFLLKTAILIFSASLSLQVIATVTKLLRGESWNREKV
ncbi:TRAP transporter small permease subunit [Cognatishimia activa]|uniref:TRAP transporter small permease protein n=1 Tax=Cognatishimia activa TaxID=1715691 RepID=A0A0P1IRX2_9RHOB|nr:TRAP transporter small permease subunit [Cognatishimia activa]MEE2944215.1 TRAP transporter small permease subunit [Pseudomonadota bacterium]CUJ00094.1 TRAP-type mannitol/chloroaromatic compound transport system, small permease component [Cognatishimia activa]CUK26214.1 TRAP-type mannitol/chloroaromatic compound transport system, small permease component [Cognatishimia activa]